MVLAAGREGQEENTGRGLGSYPRTSPCPLHPEKAQEYTEKGPRIQPGEHRLQSRVQQPSPGRVRQETCYALQEDVLKSAL